MMRVVIADDEEKVCQLICNLVDWAAIEMEVVGIGHNGIEAFELVKKLQPDLLITDIRMPGYDGLELIRLVKEEMADIDIIIISGYRHFEYAQKAIRYGVGDYLLKPIKKEELIATLNDIKEKYKFRKEQLSTEERLKLRLKSDIEKIRSNLFAEILFRSNKTSELLSQIDRKKKGINLQEINDKYYYHFKKGCFQTGIVKIDLEIKDENKESREFLEDKTAQIITKHLKEKCFDMEISINDSAVCFILNYDSTDSKSIRKTIRMLFDELMVQKSALGNIDFTLGVGFETDDISQIHASYKSAKDAIVQRLFLGTNRIIEQVKIEKDHWDHNYLLSDLNKKISSAIEILDKEKVVGAIIQLKETVKTEPNMNGYDIIKVAQESCNIYLMLLRNYHFIDQSTENIYEKFCARIHFCGSIEDIFSLLIHYVQQSLDHILEEKKQADTRPIRIAKQYIKENYMKPISLEEVSDYVGFNASYFSTVFKKETGINFLEYLSEVRMNQAKELLKSTKLNVSEICEKVGYNDVKHFTKYFKKIVGIKPNEYRKLYS
ncbi:MAG: response regulator [Clostridiales bacterium]|nr:response regulator [Clostridiales bacterium]